MATPPRPQVPKLPESVNYTFSMVMAADQVGQNFDTFPVPAGASVYVRALITNAQTMYVATRREELAVGLPAKRVALTPNVQIPYPVANLNEIWAQGKAGDVLQIQVVGNPR